MYVEIGDCPTPRRFADLAPQLSPRKSEQGYGTTDRTATRDLFWPLLRDVLPGQWVSAALAVIWQWGSIPPHEDGTDGGRLYRVMVVLQTNPDAWCLHDGAWQQLREGGIYAADPTRPHAAINWGGEPRIHLVVDRAVEP